MPNPKGHALLRQPKAEPPTFNPAQVQAAAGGAAADALTFKPLALLDPASQILGDSGSSESLRVLQEHTSRIKRLDTLVVLKEALVRFKGGDWQGGGECALQALQIDEKCGEAWQVLAIARDKCNDFTTALTCYETALKLMPDDIAIANDLGRLAFKMGYNDLAERFFRYFLTRQPHHPEAVNNMATVLRELSRYDEAIDLLRDAIGAHPGEANLWNALGTVVVATGDNPTAAIFYEEALKLDPNHVHALYNLGNIHGSFGDPDTAIQYLLRALPMFVDAMNIHTCKLSLAFAHLIKGDLRQGWSWYEARSKDDTHERMIFAVNRPRWSEGKDLRGKRVFVSAEQGLGDEIMFATVLPDLVRELGPEGHLTIGVESRLVPLFQKGFPDCTIVRHHTTKVKTNPVRFFPDVTDFDSYDYFAIMGDFLGRYRSRIEDFPKSNVFFHPDPERVAYWKAVLDGVNGKPKIGILWKSLIKHARRDRFYSPFEQWKDVLAVEDVQFVNLQYGDTGEELAQAAEMGFDIWTPPGIDLKNDLDDLSALCRAMDCILCPANATGNIAGATGTPVWMISPVNSWNSLGTDYFPWYPSTRVFFSPSLTDWSQVMGELRDALVDTYAGKAARALSSRTDAA